MGKKEKTKDVWDGYVNKNCPNCGANDYKEIPVGNEEAQGEKLRCNNCGHESELMLL